MESSQDIKHALNFMETQLENATLKKQLQEMQKKLDDIEQQIEEKAIGKEASGLSIWQTVKEKTSK